MRMIKAAEDGLCCPENAVYMYSAVLTRKSISALFTDTLVGERMTCFIGQVSG